MTLLPVTTELSTPPSNEGWVDKAKDGLSRIWTVIRDRKMLLAEIVSALFLTVLACIHWPSALVAACILPVVIWIERSKIAPLEKENQELIENRRIVNENNQMLSKTEQTVRMALKISETNLKGVQDERDRAKARYEKEMPDWIQAREALKYQNKDLQRKIEAEKEEKQKALQIQEKARSKRDLLIGENASLQLQITRLEAEKEALRKTVEQADGEKLLAFKQRDEALIPGSTRLGCEVELLSHQIEHMKEELCFMKNERDKALETQIALELEQNRELEARKALELVSHKETFSEEMSLYLLELQDTCTRLGSEGRISVQEGLPSLLLEFNTRKDLQARRIQEAIDLAGNDWNRKLSLLETQHIFMEQANLLDGMARLIMQEHRFHTPLPPAYSSCGKEILNLHPTQ